MVPRENKNNAYAKFGRINKEYYGIFRSGLLGYRQPLTIKRVIRLWRGNKIPSIMKPKKTLNLTFIQ